MGQGKQAKVLTETQIKAVLAAVDGRRYPKRDRVMVLLSIRAGLRAKEIALARWSMATDAEGNVGDALHLPNKASKGKNGGRTVWLRAELRDALVALQAVRNPDSADYIIHSERDAGMSPGAGQVWFHRLYQDLGFAGASSHSGRRYHPNGQEDRRGRRQPARRSRAGRTHFAVDHTALHPRRHRRQAARGRSVVRPDPHYALLIAAT